MNICALSLIKDRTKVRMFACFGVLFFGQVADYISHKFNENNRDTSADPFKGTAIEGKD